MKGNREGWPSNNIQLSTQSATNLYMTSFPNTQEENCSNVGYGNDESHGTHYNNSDSKSSDVDFLYYELIYWIYIHTN
jgi:hypothetical protein